MRLRRSPEDGSGAGGGTPPPADPPKVDGAPAAPPAPDTAALQQRLAQLESENRQLLDYASRVQPQGGGQPPPEDDALDLNNVDPTTLKLLSKVERSYMQRLENLQEQVDYANFTSTAKDSGASKEELAESERIYRNWKANGFKTTDASGQLKPASRVDALVFATGAGKLSAGRAAAQKTQMEAMQRALNMQAVVEPSGRVGAPAGLGEAEIDALPVEQRMTERAKKLDENGF